MDKQLIKKRFGKALSTTYTAQATVQQHIAGKMADLIGQYLPPSAHRNVLEVGCGTGLFTRKYLEQHTPGQLCLNDICPEVAHCFTDLLDEHIHFLGGDAEKTDFSGNRSLIASCSAVQWFDSPLHFFHRCSRMLSSEGYIGFSTFGQKNLTEVSSLTGQGLPYLSRQELEQSLKKDYRIVYSKEELIRLSFPNPMEVLKHLKETGVNSIGRQQWTRGKLADFCSHYTTRYSLPDHTVSLTYHPIYIIAKKIAS